MALFYPRAQAALDRGSHDEFDLYGLLGGTMAAIDSGSMEGIIDHLDRHYRHGGGWHDFQGFTLHGFDSNKPQLRYPDDPPTEAVCCWKVGDHYVILFDHAWVAVAENDNNFRVARMD